MMGDVMHIRGFHVGDLKNILADGKRIGRGKSPRTISMKSAPTWSSPSPTGTALPSAASRRLTNSSANSARSEMLLKMIRASSRVIGGPSKVADEVEAVG